MSRPEPTPYRSTARRYREAGWANPIPVGGSKTTTNPDGKEKVRFFQRGKNRPPDGFTGYTGRDVAGEDIERWLAGREGERNLALRLLDGQVGVDVDAYDGREGAETLAKAEAELGELPATWKATSRGHDQPSGIRLFRTPPGLDWGKAQKRLASRFGGNIDIVHRGHRYVVCYPSEHPETGLTYQWYGPDGRISGTLPTPEELPDLPAAWVAFLTAPEHEPGRGEPKPAYSEGETIPVGQRRGTMLAYAGQLRARGLPLAEAEVLFRHRWRQLDQPADDPSPWEKNRAILLDVYGRYEAGEPRARRPETGDRQPETGRQLPEEFWAARPYLKHVREAAWARGRSPEAVLAAVLARVAADTPHDRKLPPIVGAAAGLSLNVGLCGPPGAGKSSTARIATELVPARVLAPQCDGVPPGSGEGLIELLFEQVEEELPNGKTRPVKRQTRHNAYVYLDEGELLASQTRRTSGSASYLPTLRAIFTDATIGQANASEDRRRIVRQGQYVIGTVTGFQPERTEPLFADAGAGTPQRFLWAATDTEVPPPAERPAWPGPLARPAEPRPVWTDDLVVYFDLDASVREQVMERDWQRQQRGCDALDEHADLLQLKVAAVLAVLDARYSISEEDFELAGVVRRASDATRSAAQAAIAAEQAKREEVSHGRQARAAVASVEAVNRRQVEVAARRIAERVWGEPEGLTSTALRRALTKLDREVLAEAITTAVKAGWVVEEREPSHTGSERRRLRPGKERP